MYFAKVYSLIWGISSDPFPSKRISCLYWNSEENSGGGFGAKKNFEKREGNFTKKNNDSAENAENAYKQRLERLEAKKIFSQVEIFVKERDPIFSVKAALSRLVAPGSFVKKTKVTFVIEMQGKKARIELPEGYLLDESDLARLRAIDKIFDVSAN